MGWIFLGYVWGSKNDSFTFMMASQGLLSGWIGCLKFLRTFSFISERWGST